MNNIKGRLDIFIGSMFSGKTSALLRKLSQFSDLGLSTLYINHSNDNRSENSFSTHSSLQNISSNITFMKINNFNNLEINKYDIIGIDEAQFFDCSLIDFVKNLVEKYNKYVIIVGLDADFNRNKFGYILDLIPFADKVSKLHAYCSNCSKNGDITTALFSHYNKTKSENNIIIGGKNLYQPLCRNCYLKLN
jgi:thymidine kinase